MDVYSNCLNCKAGKEWLIRRHNYIGCGFCGRWIWFWTGNMWIPVE